MPLRSRLQGYWIEAGSIHHGDNNTHVITSTCEVEDLVIIINNYLWVLHFCNMQTHCLGVMVHNHFSTLWRACYNLWTLSCFVLDMDATLFALWFYFYVLFDFLWDIWLHWLYLLVVGLIHYWHMIQFESLPWSLHLIYICWELTYICSFNQPLAQTDVFDVFLKKHFRFYYIPYFRPSDIIPGSR